MFSRNVVSRSRQWYFLLVLLLLLPAIANADQFYGGGDGSEQTPFQINTAAHLIELSNRPEHWISDTYFVLTDDIDMDPNVTGVPPFPGALIAPDTGSSDFPKFSGNFDGAGHIISNLHINAPDSDCVGLFGFLTGKVEKLGLENVSVTGDFYVGALAGCNRGIISQCYSTGNVTGYLYVGGLMAGGEYGNPYEDLGAANDCYSSASVTGFNFVAGLDGGTYSFFHGMGISSDLTHCYSTGVVSGSRQLYGLAAGGVNFFLPFNSYWDVDTSLVANYDWPHDCIIGLSTGHMKSMKFYSHANFSGNVWTIDDGNDYPRLAWENKPGVPIEEVDSVMAGNGTEQDPFQIADTADLRIVCSDISFWDKHLVLTADLDMSGIYTTPIGWSFKNLIIHTSDSYDLFEGVFDGSGHVIRNLTISIPDYNYVGLFSALRGSGQIKNLGLENAAIEGYDKVGGLVGWNTGKISQCFVTGSVSGNNEVGGLVGHNESIIDDCYSRSSVDGNALVAGLVGLNYSLHTSQGGPISRCYSAGPVSANEWSSFGFTNPGPVFDCFWDFDISGTSLIGAGTGLSTDDMMQVDSFDGWDFVGEIDNGDLDIWRLCQNGSGYPKLAWEFAGYGDFVCPDGVWYEDFDYFDIRWQQDGCDGIFGDEGGTVDIDVLANICNLWLTAECSNCQGSDLNGDGDVNVKDFSKMASQWLCTSEVNWNRADLDGNGTVGYEDLDILAESWINGL